MRRLGEFKKSGEDASHPEVRFYAWLESGRWTCSEAGTGGRFTAKSLEVALAKAAIMED